MDIGGGGVGGEGGGFDPPPGRGFGQLRMCVPSDSVSTAADWRRWPKAVGWMHLTDENEAGARNLLFG